MASTAPIGLCGPAPERGDDPNPIDGSGVPRIVARAYVTLAGLVPAGAGKHLNAGTAIFFGTGRVIRHRTGGYGVFLPLGAGSGQCAPKAAARPREVGNSRQTRPDDER